MERSSITIEGLRLSYFRQGRGKDLLFVHGLANWSAVWEPLARIVSGSFRSTALDLPGHGSSDLTPPGSSLSDISAAIARFIPAAGIQRPIIAAHSFGCLPVLAGLPSFDADAILFVAPYLGNRRSLPWLAPLTSPERDRLFRVNVGVKGLRKIFGNLLHQEAELDEQDVTRIFEPFEEESRRIALVRFSDMAAEAPSWKDMAPGTVACPVRIVCGRDDPLSDEASVGAFADVMNAEIEMFENCGHFPQLEQARRLAGVIQGLAAASPS